MKNQLTMLKLDHNANHQSETEGKSIQDRDVHGSGSLFFITVAAASTKRKFKKLVNLHKIFILKNATL